MNIPYVTRKIPVVTTIDLEAIGTKLKYGFSLHHGIIVVWDEDYDERVLTMIEQRFPLGSVKPIAVSERKGGVCLLWASHDNAMGQPHDYTVDDDCWSAAHFFLDGDKVTQSMS